MEDIDNITFLQILTFIILGVIIFYKYQIANYFKITSNQLIVYSIGICIIFLLILKKFKNKYMIKYY